MNWYDVATGFLAGAGVGIVIVAIPAINQADRMRNTILKLQVDLRYAMKRSHK